jgi:hypothetical protein
LDYGPGCSGRITTRWRSRRQKSPRFKDVGLVRPAFLLKNAGGAPIDLAIRHIFIRLPMKLLLRIFITLILAVGCCRLCYAQDAGGIYNKVDQSPTPIKTPEPKYPTALKGEGGSGIVSVTCVIDENGRVLNAKASKSTRVDFDKPVGRRSQTGPSSRRLKTANQ